MKDYDGLILELWERVQRLESEVNALKKARENENSFGIAKVVDEGKTIVSNTKKKDLPGLETN